jgi:branched-chain amino acid transport system substrate-binding protein
LSDLGKEFAKRYQAKFNEPPVYAALNGFANAIVFAAAIEQAKSTDPKALTKALEEGSFTGWSTSPITFPRAEGALWHNWSPPLLVLHYTAKDQTPAAAEVAYILGP